MMSQRLVGSNKDFIMALLRSQAKELDSLMTTVEESNTLDEHAESCLKRVEVNIRGLRKLCLDN